MGYAIATKGGTERIVSATVQKKPTIRYVCERTTQQGLLVVVLVRACVVNACVIKGEIRRELSVEEIANATTSGAIGMKVHNFSLWNISIFI